MISLTRAGRSDLPAALLIEQHAGLSVVTPEDLLGRKTVMNDIRFDPNALSKPDAEMLEAVLCYVAGQRAAWARAGIMGGQVWFLCELGQSRSVLLACLARVLFLLDSAEAAWGAVEREAAEARWVPGSQPARPRRAGHEGCRGWQLALTVAQMVTARCSSSSGSGSSSSKRNRGGAAANRLRLLLDSVFTVQAAPPPSRPLPLQPCDLLALQHMARAYNNHISITGGCVADCTMRLTHVRELLGWLFCLTPAEELEMFGRRLPSTLVLGDAGGGQGESAGPSAARPPRAACHPLRCARN
jgi:hypothetical protein